MVAYDQRVEEVVGHESSFVAEVLDGRRGSGDDSVNAGVACELTNRCGNEGGADVCTSAFAGSFGDRVEGDGGEELGVGPAACEFAFSMRRHRLG